MKWREQSSLLMKEADQDLLVVRKLVAQPT